MGYRIGSKFNIKIGTRFPKSQARPPSWSVGGEERGGEGGFTPASLEDGINRILRAGFGCDSHLPRQ